MSRSARLVFSLSLAAGLLAPGVGMAAGFGPPVKISGGDDTSPPSVAIAPSGRTVVIYSRTVLQMRRERTELRLVTGSAPDQLGRPAALRIPGIPTAARLTNPQLLARADGSFVLCLSAGKTQGCSIGGPAGGFGSFVALPKGGSSWQAAAVRPDGSTVLLRSVRHGDDVTRSIDLVSMVLDANGHLGAEHPIARSRDEQSYNPNSPPAAVAADGTVAIPANLPAGHGKLDRTQLGIRVMRPGSDTFGPVVAVPGDPYDNNIALISGPTITVEYMSSRVDNAYEEFDENYVPLRPDGTFGPTLALPGAGSGNVEGSLVPLPDGQLFAVTARTTTAPDDQDCYNPVTGVIGSGLLAPVGQPAPSVRLSTRGQIAWHQQAVALDDGTVIAAWHDGVNYYGARRLEASVRVPGATSFTAGQPMPGLLSYGYEPTLVAAGNHAALLWLVERGHHRYGASLMISTYRTDGPYAKSAPLPKHPGTSCDE